MKQLRAPRLVAHAGVWRVDEGDGSWSEHLTEAKALAWIAKLVATGRYLAPVD